MLLSPSHRAGIRALCAKVSDFSLSSNVMNFQSTFHFGGWPGPAATHMRQCRSNCGYLTAKSTVDACIDFFRLCSDNALGNRSHRRRRRRQLPAHASSPALTSGGAARGSGCTAAAPSSSQSSLNPQSLSQSVSQSASISPSPFVSAFSEKDQRLREARRFLRAK